MFKKLVSLFFVMVMVLSLGACSGDKASSKTVNNDGMLSDELIELKAFYNQNPDSEDGQYETFKEAAKLTNINITCTVPKSNTDFNQAFNLMIASGDIPDLVQTYDPTGFARLGNEGAFVPLDEYIDEYMPNVKKLLEERPDVKANITAFDGHIYYLPMIPAGVASTGWIIRQDWLDKLNLKAPTNAEEMYQVLTAFRNQDPNGNGMKDEVPLFGTRGLDEAMTLWDARPGFYVKDGKIGYGPYEKQYRTAMENLVKWYQEGLIDQEILTRTGDFKTKLVGDNVGGMCNEWFGSTCLLNDSLADKVPGLNLQPIAPPSGIELNRRSINYPYGWGVSAFSKHIEEAVRYLDFWYSERGGMLMNFGIEGKNYDMIDGKPVFKPEMLADGKISANLHKEGAQLEMGFLQDFEYERQWINETGYNGMKMYEENGYIVEQFPVTITAWMSDDEAKEYSKLHTDVTTYADEMFFKWMMGSEDIEKTWDTYMNSLKDFGADRLIELQQDVYNRVVK